MQNENHDAEYWIRVLQLQSHPEGGWFRQTYRAPLTIPAATVLSASSASGDRAASTAIYYLLEGVDFSAFHRIAFDEMWHFYAGDALHVVVIDPSGCLTTIELGRNVEQGQTLQAVVPGGHWFAARLARPLRFALVGCTVAPGFDFADFEMASRQNLQAEFPQHRGLIEELTRLGPSAPHHADAD